MVNLPVTVARIFTRLAQVAAALFVVCVVALIVALAIGSTQLTRLANTLRPRAEQELQALLGRDVRIGAVQISGLNGVVFRDLQIAAGKTFTDGTAATAKEARATVNLLSLALHRGQNPLDAVSRITVNTPDMEVSRDVEGRWDFQDILDRLNANPGARGRLHARIVVADGRVTLHDAQGFGGQAPMTQRLVGVRGSMASRGAQNYRFLVSARDDARRLGNIKLTGNYSADSGSTRVSVTADNISVNAVAKFLPEGLPITFENGKAALRMTALFTALPTPGRAISTDRLTAEVDLSGVGLRLREMSSPIMATSGRLRLVHDRKRYPQGSRLEFMNVHARADRIPLTLSGKLTELNLFDLAHAQPQVDLTLTAAGQGPQFQQLFPKTDWLHKVSLSGDTKLVAEVTGKSTGLRIDGTLHNERAVIRGMALDRAGVTFRLSPGVNAPGKRNSLELTARVKHAALGESQYRNLRLALASTTPWRSLEKAVQLRGSASVGEASMPWGTARDIRGRVTVSRDGVQFDEIRAALFGGEVTAGPLVVPLSTTPGGLVLSAGGSYRDIDLVQLTKALNVKDLSGRGDGTFTLSLDDAENLRFSTDLHATGVVYQGKRASDLTAALRVASSGGVVAIDIPTADARTEYGRFTVADGRYHRDGSRGGSGTLHLPVQGDQVVLRKFHDKLIGSAKLNGTVQGDLSALTLTAHVTAGNGSLLNREFTSAESDITYSAKELRLRNIVFTRKGMTGRVLDTAQGLDPRESLVGLVATVDLHGAAVDDVTSLFGQQSPWRIDGGAVGTVDVRYTDRGLELAGNATIPDAVVHVPTGDDAYPLALDRLGLVFTYADRTMQIQDLALERVDSTLHGAGTAGSRVGEPLRADMEFTSTSARLEDLPLDLFHIPVPLNGEAQIAGSLHGVLDGSGPEPLAVDVNVSAPQFAAAGVPAEHGNVELRYLRRQDGSELIVNRATADGAFRADGAGRFYLDQRRMEGVTLTLRGIDLAKLSAMMRDNDLPVALTLPDGLAGRGQVEISGDGSYAKPDLTLGFNFNRLAVGTAPLPDLRGQVRGIVTDGRYRLRIDELAASSDGTEVARVTGDIDPGRSVDVKVNADKITARLLAPWVPDLQYDGQLSFDGAVRGPWKNPALDGDLHVADLQYGGRVIPSAGGHLRLDASQLALSDGRVQLLAAGAPLQISGKVPVHWESFRPEVASDRPLSLNIDLPRQDLAALKPLLPGVKTLAGSVGASLNVAGTPAQPRFSDSWLEVRGDAGFDMGDPGFADTLQNLQLRASITGGPRQTTFTLDRLSATVAQSRKGGAEGYLIAGGSVGIANENLLNPQRWQWNVKANISDVPVPASLVVVPKATGVLQLVSEGKTPVLKGVVVLDRVKLKQPKMGDGGGTWGPFAFNPRMEVAVHVGNAVKMSQSIFSVPLLPTPLPFPDLAVTSETTILPYVPLDAYAPLFSRAATAREMTGTWATVTGTLSDPRLYARFEVDKEHLAFPLNLIGSVRRAKGHVTYTKADGPKIVMGIPKFPTEPATAAANPTPPATAAN